MMRSVALPGRKVDKESGGIPRVVREFTEAVENHFTPFPARLLQGKGQWNAIVQKSVHLPGRYLPRGVSQRIRAAKKQGIRNRKRFSFLHFPVGRPAGAVYIEAEGISLTKGIIHVQRYAVSTVHGGRKTHGANIRVVNKMSGLNLFPRNAAIPHRLIVAQKRQKGLAGGKIAEYRQPGISIVLIILLEGLLIILHPVVIRIVATVEGSGNHETVIVKGNGISFNAVKIRRDPYLSRPTAANDGKTPFHGHAVFFHSPQVA